MCTQMVLEGAWLLIGELAGFKSGHSKHQKRIGFGGLFFFFPWKSF